MLPATRMTKRSPKPWSKTISTGTRESEQPRMAANGSWLAANSRRRARPVIASRLPMSDTNRWLPSCKSASASRAKIIEASRCVRAWRSLFGAAPAYAHRTHANWNVSGYEGRPVELPRYPNSRAGRNRMVRSKANMASNVMPIARNGSDKSHRKGQRTRARSASGQHNTHRRHQATIASNAFTEVSPRFLRTTVAYLECATASTVGAHLGAQGSSGFPDRFARGCRFEDFHQSLRSN